jgi:hypothetical protein
MSTPVIPSILQSRRGVIPLRYSIRALITCGMELGDKFVVRRIVRTGALEKKRINVD